MTLTTRLTLGVVCFGLGSLGACGEAENPIGILTKGSSPDEFAVISRAPLVVPRGGSLPEPDPGAPSPLDPDPQRTAILALTGGPDPSAGGVGDPSASERALLAGTEASAANPSIRDQLERDAEPDEDAPYEPPSVLELFVEPRKKPLDRATLLDPDREARRLQTGGAVAPVNPNEEPPEPEEPESDDFGT